MPERHTALQYSRVAFPFWLLKTNRSSELFGDPSPLPRTDTTTPSWGRQAEQVTYRWLPLNVFRNARIILCSVAIIFFRFRVATSTITQSANAHSAESFTKNNWES